MASILYAYHDGEWKRERIRSINDARRVAFLGESRGEFVPIRIDSEKYYKGRTEVRTYWNREDDGPFTEYAREHLTRFGPPEWMGEGDE